MTNACMHAYANRKRDIFNFKTAVIIAMTVPVYTPPPYRSDGTYPNPTPPSLRISRAAKKARCSVCWKCGDGRAAKDLNDLLRIVGCGTGCSVSRD